MLGGAIAIVGSVELQRTYGLLKQRESLLEGLKEALKNSSGVPQEHVKASSGVPQEQTVLKLALVHHLHYLERVIFPLLHSPRLWKLLSQPLKQSADLVEQIISDSGFEDHLQITFAYSLADYCHITNRLASSRFRTSLGFAAGWTVPSLVIAGLCCFMAGTSCLVLDSQPVQVWATSFGVLGAALLLLLTFLAFIIGVPRPIELPFNNV